jgi:hypothetical protein
MKLMLFDVFIYDGAIIETAIFGYVTDELFFLDGGLISRDSVYHDIIPSIDDEGVESNVRNQFILNVLNFLLRLTDL